MIDLMLDIETLGNGPGCVITSVAIVPFRLNGKPLEAGDVDSYICKLHIGEQLAEGYTLNQDTFNWWMKNDKEVRLKEFSGTDKLIDFCSGMHNYMLKVNDLYTNYRIWSTSAKLDFGCIHYTFNKEGSPYPFDHRAELCARTVRNLTKVLVPTYKLDVDTGRNHDAIQDCRVQITQLQDQYKELRKLTTQGIEVDKFIADNVIYSQK